MTDQFFSHGLLREATGCQTFRSIALKSYFLNHVQRCAASVPNWVHQPRVLCGFHAGDARVFSNLIETFNVHKNSVVPVVGLLELSPGPQSPFRF